MTPQPLRIASFAVALLAIGTSLSAQAPRPGFGPGLGSMAGGRGLRGLNLTEPQQTQVKAIHEKHQAALKAKGEAAGAAHTALFDAMKNPATDAGTLKTLHDKASSAQFELMLEHRAVQQEILPLLTPEQKTQFEKLPMGPHMGRGPGRRGMGRGPGFGPGMNPGGPMNQPS